MNEKWKRLQAILAEKKKNPKLYYEEGGKYLDEFLDVIKIGIQTLDWYVIDAKSVMALKMMIGQKKRKKNESVKGEVVEKKKRTKDTKKS